MERRLEALERWRIHQLTWDTATVTGINDRLDTLDASVAEIRTSIGDLEGRSVASRLISMSIDIGNMVSRQDAMASGLDAMVSRQDVMASGLDAMVSRQDVMDGRLTSIEADVGCLKSDVAQILQILREPKGDK
ncbi:hypothetical protein [Nocardia sp. NPDC052112]|uniref:hypothetical protein n=1 Tax=Nocardia sp. NPDC052112 TaxID=3155646 RepID=UPI00343543E5